MLRSSNNLLGQRQSPSSLDPFRRPNDPLMKPVEARSSRQSFVPESHDRELSHRSPRIDPFSTRFPSHSPEESRRSRPPTSTLDNLMMKPRSSRLSPHDDRHFMVDQPIHPSSSRLSSASSLKSLLIDGRWKYREEPDDELRLKAKGINNLVVICHDIMRTTAEAPARKPERRERRSFSHTGPWPLVKLDQFKRLSNGDRKVLDRAQLLSLMTIVYEATSTHASIGELVRIWREATAHHSRRRPIDIIGHQPLISYPTAFGHLIQNPHDHLLHIGLHAALIGSHSRKDLQRLGQQLGVERNQFDMGSIRESTRAFHDLIHLLRSQKIRQRREQLRVDINRVPYEPKKKRGLQANVLATRFPIVRQALDLSGFVIRPDSDFTCDLLWNDSIISTDLIAALKPHQKVNHFMSMNEISRKDLLIKNYYKLSSVLPNVYDFLPRTWLLPNEYHLWHAHASKQPKKNPLTYILKPLDPPSSLNRIQIHCDYKKINATDSYLIQEYIREPCLMNGFKFDVRVYVLVTSCDPLRVYIFNNGLVHLSPEKYQLPTEENVSNLHIHLTNHRLTDETMGENFGIDFQRQRSLEDLFSYLGKHKHNIETLWHNIQNLVLRTIFLVAPHLFTAYEKSRPGATAMSESVCFELLSFDLLIDRSLKPWLIEVDRCPDFHINEQIEFDVKIKMLVDALILLHLQVADREKSHEIEKAETQRRLFLSLGKSNLPTNDPKLTELKESFSLLQRDNARDAFERETSKGFIRLFPVKDEYRMDDLMKILTQSFEILREKKNDSTWMTKFTYRLNEEKLFNEIVQLESKTSSTIVENKSPSRDRSNSSTDDSFQKQRSTQTPLDIVRVTSTSSMKKMKKKRNPRMTSGRVSRPRAESREKLPGVSASRITEKKFYETKDRPVSAEPRKTPSPKPKRSNEKSQMVTPSSILRATRQDSTPNSSVKTHVKEQLHLTDNDIDRLHQILFEQMKKFSLHYPNKTEKQTDKICNEIIDQWEFYKPLLARFWFAELDTEKRKDVVEIVWNNIQQIMKKVCLIDELIGELPLNRHLLILKRRLLANNGQCLWDFCQDRHNSWESTFVKSSHRLSSIELNCCYRFVDLCRDALFIVYRYSLEEQRSIDVKIEFVK